MDTKTRMSKKGTANFRGFVSTRNKNSKCQSSSSNKEALNKVKPNDLILGPRCTGLRTKRCETQNGHTSNSHEARSLNDSKRTHGRTPNEYMSNTKMVKQEGQTARKRQAPKKHAYSSFKKSLQKRCEDYKANRIDLDRKLPSLSLKRDLIAQEYADTLPIPVPRCSMNVADEELDTEDETSDTASICSNMTPFLPPIHINKSKDVVKTNGLDKIERLPNISSNKTSKMEVDFEELHFSEHKKDDIKKSLLERKEFRHDNERESPESDYLETSRVGSNVTLSVALANVSNSAKSIDFIETADKTSDEPRISRTNSMKESVYTKIRKMSRNASMENANYYEDIHVQRASYLDIHREERLHVKSMSNVPTADPSTLDVDKYIPQRVSSSLLYKDVSVVDQVEDWELAKEHSNEAMQTKHYENVMNKVDDIDTEVTSVFESVYTFATSAEAHEASRAAEKKSLAEKENVIIVKGGKKVDVRQVNSTKHTRFSLFSKGGETIKEINFQDEEDNNEIPKWILKRISSQISSSFSSRRNDKDAEDEMSALDGSSEARWRLTGLTTEHPMPEDRPPRCALEYFALAIPKHHVRHHCELCSTKASLVCAGCQVTFYCCSQHFQADNDHQRTCDMLANVRRSPGFLPTSNQRERAKMIREMKMTLLIDRTAWTGIHNLYSEKYELAEMSFTQALRYARAMYGGASSHCAELYILKAVACVELGRGGAAAALLARATGCLHANPHLLENMSLMADFHQASGLMHLAEENYDECAFCLSESLYLVSFVNGPNTIKTARTYFHLGECFFYQNFNRTAETFFVHSLENYLGWLTELLAATYPVKSEADKALLPRDLDLPKPLKLPIQFEGDAIVRLRKLTKIFKRRKNSWFGKCLIAFGLLSFYRGEWKEAQKFILEGLNYLHLDGPEHALEKELLRANKLISRVIFHERKIWGKVQNHVKSAGLLGKIAKLKT